METTSRESPLLAAVLEVALGAYYRLPECQNAYAGDYLAQTYAAHPNSTDQEARASRLGL